LKNEELESKIKSCGLELTDVKISELENVDDKVKVECILNDHRFSVCEFKSFIKHLVDIKLKTVDCCGKRIVFNIVYKKYDVREKEWFNAFDEWQMYRWD
jgi:hypothetical protein